MKKIYCGKVLIGIKIGKIKSGSIPITDTKEAIQLVTLKHAKGSILKAHLHVPVKRITQRLQECMVVKKGKVEVGLYSPEKKYFKSILLDQGEAFILLQGGCSLHMLRDSEIIEIKNGPFKEDKELI
jgi:hypothetical protein